MGLAKPQSRIAACLALGMAWSTPALAGDAFTAEFSGRFHWDFARFDNDGRGNDNANGAEVRRFRMDVSGALPGRFGYKAEVNVAAMQDDFNSKGIVAHDVYLTRRFDSGLLTVGQYKQYFSLDDRTGSNYGAFLERGSAALTLAPLYRKGVSWQAAGSEHTWAASAYSLKTIDVSNVEGNGVLGRATWAPGATDGDVRHLGLSLAREHYEHPGARGTPALRIRPRPAGHLSDGSRLTLASFDAGRDTDVSKWSLEYAQVHGPLSWQGEFGGGVFDDGAQRATVLSAYAFMSWFVTGESRAYDHKTGRFTRIRGVNHRAGALELAMRYDHMQGRQHADGQPDRIDAATGSWTLGANWYLKPNLRLMLDLIDSRNRDRLSATTTDHTRALTGRVHYDF